MRGSLTKLRAVHTRRLAATMCKPVKISLVGVDRIQLVKTNLYASCPFVQIGHVRITLGLYLKTRLRAKKNEFDLHENKHVGGTNFHMNGFARRLVFSDTEAKGNSEMVYFVACA